MSNSPIRMACEKNYVEIVRLFLEDKRIDPAALRNYPIRISAEKGYLDLVKLLMKDPR